MGLLKLLAGFLVGLIACGILLFLISVRSPINTEPRIAVVPEPVTVEPIESTEIEEPAATEEEAVEQNDVAEDENQGAEPTVTKPESDASDETTEDVVAPEATEQEQPAATEEAESSTSEDGTENDVEDTATDRQTPKDDSAEPAPEVTEPKEAPKTASKLPTIGSDGGSRIKLSGDEPKEGEVESFGAFELNAQNFVGRELPVVSIILVDVGAEGAGRSALLSLPVPISFGITTGQEGAARASADYRDAGQEVLIVPPLDGSLTDASMAGKHGDEVLAYTAALPDALGLVDAPSAGLQKDRAALKAVLEEFKTSGHALLTYDFGLNSADREAAKVGVKSAKVFRVLDAKKEDTASILRQLDRAILEANQEGAAIVLGHSYADTIEAIQTWSQGGSASGVDVAPVSAAIRALSQ